MSKIKLKRSSVPSKIPIPSDLDLGELAINTYDGKIFLKQIVGTYTNIVSVQPLKVSNITGGSTTNEITQISSIRFDTESNFTVTDLGGGNVKISSTASQNFNVSLISAGNTQSSTVSNVTTLAFDSDSGFDVTNLGNGIAKVAMNSTFKNWNVDGSPGLVAEGLDTVNFIASTGTRIVALTSGTSKSLTFSVNTATTATVGGVKIGDGLTISNDGKISTTDISKSVFLYQDGFLTVKTGTIRWYAPQSLVLDKIIGRVAFGADQDIRVSSKLNGSSFNLLTISTGTTKTEETVDINMIVDDYLTVDVIQVGTQSQPGFGLSVEFKYRLL